MKVTVSTLGERDSRSQVATVLPFMAITLVSLMLIAGASFTAANAGTPVVVLFPPLISPEVALTAILSADGTPVREGLWSAIQIAQFDTPGFAERLQDAGALFVLGTDGLGACFTYF